MVDLFTLSVIGFIIYLVVKLNKNKGLLSRVKKVMGWLLLINMVTGLPSMFVMGAKLIIEECMGHPVYMAIGFLLLLLVAMPYIDIIITAYWMTKGRTRLPLIINWCWGLISLPYYLFYRFQNKEKGCVCSLCNTKFRLPVYGCDNKVSSCQKQHKRLEPRFGKIKSAPCTCGNLLPRTDTIKVLGETVGLRTRTALPAYCPNCGELLDDFTAQRLKYSSIVILGATNETRRRFRQNFIYHFINSEAQKHGLIVECSNERYDNHTSSVTEWSSIKNYFPKGVIQQTENFEFKFTVTLRKQKAMLHIYTLDQSNEQWNSRKAKVFNISEKNGVVLVLRGDVSGCQELETEVRRLVDALQQTTGMKKKNGKYIMPLVIAIDNAAGLIDEKQGDIACRNFIINQTQTGGNALVLLDHNFVDLRFCAYSSESSAAQIVKHMLWE